jgi:hypothetical protein
VAGHSPHHPKDKGLSPAPATGPGKEKVTKRLWLYFLWVICFETYRGCIFSRVRPFYEQAVSDLDT